MRYMRHITPKMYHRPKLGRACWASDMVFPLRRDFRFDCARARLPGAILAVCVGTASRIADGDVATKWAGYCAAAILAAKTRATCMASRPVPSLIWWRQDV